MALSLLLSVSMQIFVCPLGGLFCDNFVVGGGTLVGSTTITDQLLTTFPTFAGVAPGQPFNITEVFIFSQDRGSYTNPYPSGLVECRPNPLVCQNIFVPETFGEEPQKDGRGSRWGSDQLYR